MENIVFTEAGKALLDKHYQTLSDSAVPLLDLFALPEAEDRFVWLHQIHTLPQLLQPAFQTPLLQARFWLQFWTLLSIRGQRFELGYLGHLRVRLALHGEAYTQAEPRRVRAVAQLLRINHVGLLAELDQYSGMGNEQQYEQLLDSAGEFSRVLFDLPFCLEFSSDWLTAKIVEVY